MLERKEWHSNGKEDILRYKTLFCWLLNILRAGCWNLQRASFRVPLVQMHFISGSFEVSTFSLSLSPPYTILGVLSPSTSASFLTSLQISFLRQSRYVDRVTFLCFPEQFGRLFGTKVIYGVPGVIGPSNLQININNYCNIVLHCNNLHANWIGLRQTLATNSAYIKVKPSVLWQK